MHFAPSRPTIPKRTLATFLAAALLTTILVTTPIAQAQSNDPPVADAGSDFSVVPGLDATGFLNASGSFDLDGSARDLDFEWEVLTEEYDWITLTPTGNPRGRSAEFQVPPSRLVDQTGVYFIEFQLTVTDPDGASDRDRVRVTFSQRPVAIIEVAAKLPNPDAIDTDGDGKIEDEEKYTIEAVIDGPGEGGNDDDEWDVKEGAQLTLDGSSSTGAGASRLTYRWQKQTARPNLQEFDVEPGDEAKSAITIDIPDEFDNDRGAVIHYRLTITNDDGVTASALVKIQVHDQPAAPTVEIGLRDQSQPAQVAFHEDEEPRYVVAPGDRVVLTATADDRDGTQVRSLTHEWSGNKHHRQSRQSGRPHLTGHVHRAPNRSRRCHPHRHRHRHRSHRPHRIEHRHLRGGAEPGPRRRCPRRPHQRGRQRGGFRRNRHHAGPRCRIRLRRGCPHL